MNKYKTIIFLFLLSQLRGTTVSASGISLAGVEQVVLDIYNAFQLDALICPEVIITDSNTKVASYNSHLHAIKIEKSVLNICASYGADSLNALAFIIGHEMTHAYQEMLNDESKEYHFLDYSNNINSSYKIEKTADIQGAFTAYVAGYQTHHIIPQLLTDIYQDYGLHNKTLSRYPSYQERITTGNDVQQTVRALTTAHRLANMMTLFECYDVSNAIYDDILSYYEGPELYYNIGLNYLFEALNFSQNRIDKYAYPFEIEAETRMNKPFEPGGSKDLSIEELQQRQMLLNKAETLITKAISKNVSKTSWQVALAAIYILNEKPSDAIEYLLTIKERTESLEMVLAIALGTKNDFYSIQRANELFSELKGSTNRVTQMRATYNNEVLYGRTYDCDDIESPQSLLENKAISLKELRGVSFNSLPVEGTTSIKQGMKEKDNFYLVQHAGKSYYIKDHMLKKELFSEVEENNYNQFIKLGTEYVFKTKGKRIILEFLTKEGTTSHTASVLY